MNNFKFDWALVPSFLAALEHGSLLGAARASKLSQPTVGRHIAALEQQLGAVLFERTGRGLLPSALALRLGDAARAMDAGAAALSRAASGANASVRGSVRISASQPVACVLLPPILARLRDALPDIQIELVASNAISNLLRREADIALRMVRPEQQGLITKRIGAMPLFACAHRDYLKRFGVPRQPQDLLRHHIIGGDRNDDIQRGFAARGVSLGAGPKPFVLCTDDLMAAWAAVQAGLGLGFAAHYLIRTDPEVQTVLPELKLPQLALWLTVHREIRTNKRVRAVYDFLAEALIRAWR